jgi:hypothetical protein
LPSGGRHATEIAAHRAARASLFGVGVARAAVTHDRWWRTGFEMLMLGGLVAGAGYAAGAVVAAIVR